MMMEGWRWKLSKLKSRINLYNIILYFVPKKTCRNKDSLCLVDEDEDGDAAHFDFILNFIYILQDDCVSVGVTQTNK